MAAPLRPEWSLVKRGAARGRSRQFGYEDFKTPFRYPHDRCRQVPGGCGVWPARPPLRGRPSPLPSWQGLGAAAGLPSLSWLAGTAASSSRRRLDRAGLAGGRALGLRPLQLAAGARGTAGSAAAGFAAKTGWAFLWQAGGAGQGRAAVLVPPGRAGPGRAGRAPWLPELFFRREGEAVPAGALRGEVNRLGAVS